MTIPLMLLLPVTMAAGVILGVLAAGWCFGLIYGERIGRTCEAVRPRVCEPAALRLFVTPENAEPATPEEPQPRIRIVVLEQSARTEESSTSVRAKPSAACAQRAERAI